MTDEFITQIDNFVIKSEDRLLAVVKEAIAETADEVQTPKAKGGKMPVRSGFLRSSGLGAVNKIPSGPTRGDPSLTYQWSGNSIELELEKLQIGDTFTFGWTAVYAGVQEVYNGFLDSALQNWQSKVDIAVKFFADRDRS